MAQYSEASLETAACLWEAVLTLRSRYRSPIPMQSASLSRSTGHSMRSAPLPCG
ncbi:hypothetical protein ACFSUK_04395 [Sphingobium scionense]